MLNALHDLDPVFAPFSHRPEFAELLSDVGMTDPLLLQSMYLCKAARSGGEVGSHQDATFLWTDPVTVTGIWVALEDATVDNGCLWALPGGHRTVPLAQRFVRLGGDADGTAFEGNRYVDRFTVRDGLIVSMEVWNDSAERLLERQGGSA